MASLSQFYADYLAHLSNANPHGVTTTTLNLDNVDNLPLASGASAIAGTESTGYMTPRLTALRANARIQEIYQGATNIGDVPFATLDVMNPIEFDPVISELAVVTAADDLTLQQNNQFSWSDVFNTWERFALSGDPTSGDYLDEASSFVYDEPTDSIHSTINSESLIGFVSPTRYENYTLDVQLSSNRADDDSIGVVVGFVHEGDERHALTLMAHRQGMPAPALSVQFDVHMDDHVEIQTLTSSETFPDGPLWGVHNWNLIPNGIRLRVVRTGDLFECWMGPDDSTELGATPLYLSFTLNDNPELARFKGAQPVGFAAISQAGATWHTYETPTFIADTIPDLVNNQVLHYEDGSWVVTDDDVTDYVKQGRCYFNRTTGKLFLGTGNGSVEQLVDGEGINQLSDNADALELRIQALEG